MKKLLSILAAVGLSATAGASVVACGPTEKETDKGDFGIQLAKDNLVQVGVKGTLQIADYKNVKNNLEDFKIVLPKKGEAGADVIASSTFDKANGEFILEGLKVGTVDVQVTATEIKKPKTFAEGDPVLKTSGKLTLNVALAGLDIVKLDEIKKGVIDNKSVTAEEVSLIKNEVESAVTNAIRTKIAGVDKGTDFTVDTTKIVAGNLSQGVEVTAKTTAETTKLKKDTTAIFKVTFESIKKIDLSGVKLKDTRREVEDNTIVTTEEVTAIKKFVADTVKIQFQVQFPIVKDTDYTIDFSKLHEGDMSITSFIDIKASDNSAIFEKDTATHVNLTILTRVKGLDEVSIDSLNYEVINSVALTKDEADKAKDDVTKVVDKAVTGKITGAKLGTDYTMNLDAIAEGANLSAAILIIDVKAQDGSELIKLGTATRVVLTFESVGHDLNDVKLENIVGKIKDNTVVSEDDALNFKTFVKDEVQAQLVVQFDEVTAENDYDVNMDEIVSGNWFEKSVTIKVIAKEKSAIFKKDSFKEIKFTVESTAVNLGDVKLTDISNEVSFNINVTGEEVNNVTSKVTAEVQAQLVDQFDEVTAENDYSVDLSKVTTGDMSQGVNVVITAKVGSEIFKEETSVTIKATFISIEKGLNKVPFVAIPNDVTDNKKVTGEEASLAVENVKNEIKSLFDRIYGENKVALDTDYTLEKLNEIIIAGDLSSGVEITIAAINGHFFTDGTTNKIQVTFS